MRRRKLTYRGTTKDIVKWAEEKGIDGQTIRARLDQLGWSKKDALSVAPGLLQLTYQGETLTVEQWARKLRMPITTLRSRLNRGWDVERALSTPIRRRT